MLTLGISLKANPQGKASGVHESQYTFQGDINHEFFSIFSRCEFYRFCLNDLDHDRHCFLAILCDPFGMVQ